MDVQKKNIISIIVPIYKVPEKYLRRNIESLLAQSYKDIEIILVDDGSPDDCGKICDEYSQIDNRIKTIHQKNKGLSGARNSGVNNSCGDWIMFLDGDDYLENNACEFLEKLINENIDLICYGSYRVNSKGKTKVEHSGLENGKIYNTIEDIKFLRKMVLNFDSSISSAWGKIIRKKFLIENNLFHREDLKQGAEGIEFCFRLFSKSKSVLFVSKELYNYIYNENSISSKPTDENNKLILKCFQEIKNDIDEKDLELLQMFYQRLYYVIVTTIVSGYFNPKIKDKYSNRKKKVCLFLKEELIKETMEQRCVLDIKRRIIVRLIKMKFFYLVYILVKLFK